MSRFMKTLAVIVLTLMLIGSLAAGGLYSIPSSQGAYTSRTVNSYNVTLALSGVIVSVVVFSVIYSIGTVLDKLEDIRQNVAIMAKEALAEKREAQPAMSAKSGYALQESHIPKPITTHEYRECPNCGAENRKGRLLCLECGNSMTAGG